MIHLFMNDMQASTANGRVLVVGPDGEQGQTICEGLSLVSYEPESCTTASEVQEILEQGPCRIAIVDLDLPASLDVIRAVRTSSDNTGIVFITRPENVQLRRSALMAGADDFVLKPLSMRELMIRLEALEVRARLRPKTLLEAGDLRVDLSTRKAFRGERQLALTPTEFRILEILMQNPNRVVSRQTLCELVWSPEWEGMTNVIEVHMNRLRNKIGRREAHQLIVTVRGQGYLFRVPEEDGHLEWASRGLGGSGR
ncbi:MAG: DNA-binding response regulator [Pirellulaceae bacterium]|nr:MAG: DNA-binding response regulator [Pirellulaceae bacterium]